MQSSAAEQIEEEKVSIIAYLERIMQFPLLVTERILVFFNLEKREEIQKELSKIDDETQKAIFLYHAMIEAGFNLSLENFKEYVIKEKDLDEREQQAYLAETKALNSKADAINAALNRTVELLKKQVVGFNINANQVIAFLAVLFREEKDTDEEVNEKVVALLNLQEDDFLNEVAAKLESLTLKQFNNLHGALLEAELTNFDKSRLRPVPTKVVDPVDIMKKEIQANQEARGKKYKVFAVERISPDLKNHIDKIEGSDLKLTSQEKAAIGNAQQAQKRTLSRSEQVEAAQGLHSKAFNLVVDQLKNSPPTLKTHEPVAQSVAAVPSAQVAKRQKTPTAETAAVITPAVQQASMETDEELAIRLQTKVRHGNASVEQIEAAKAGQAINDAELARRLQQNEFDALARRAQQEKQDRALALALQQQEPKDHGLTKWDEDFAMGAAWQDQQQRDQMQKDHALALALGLQQSYAVATSQFAFFATSTVQVSTSVVSQLQMSVVSIVAVGMFVQQQQREAQLVLEMSSHVLLAALVATAPRQNQDHYAPSAVRAIRS